MPERQYYAHITQDGRKQPVLEHLQGTADRASACLVDVGLKQSAYLAGLLHDLGKYTEAFQTYLNEGDISKRGSVIHTFQGCRYLLEHFSDKPEWNSLINVYTRELLAFSVGAHHGVFDCVDETGKIGMQYRQKKEDTFYQEAVASLYAQGITQEVIADYFALASEEIGRIILRIEDVYEKDDDYCFEIGLLARLLLSAVIEGDRHDTASFMNQVKVPVYDVDMRPIWNSRLLFMEEKLQRLPLNSPVEKARASISNQCRAYAEQPKGIYRLNVPTGGGKTLSSLRFALAHAQQHNHKRLIFTSPLLSILEQNAAVIHEYIGDDSLILEHHSNVVQTQQTPEHLEEWELLTQSWDAPIIITTMVQLLNSMFDGKTSSIRRFQSLCNSVIVIDEVQTVPTKMLSLFNLAIRFLAEQCGATIVLCSATQPYLEGLNHPLLPPPSDIVTYDPAVWTPFVRTHLQPLGNLRLEELPKFIKSYAEDADSLLVVCNKKEEASFIFEQTRSVNYVSYHLSAAMCMQHRSDTIAALRTSLELSRKSKEKVLCVSTQVIEAGVDISFQRVIRLSAGMDSIVQSAGRCNRNGESAHPCPVYIVNCSNEKLRNLQDIQRGKNATISLLNAFRNTPDRFHKDLASNEAIHYYYKAFYSDMNADSQDYPLPKMNTTLLDMLSENRSFSSSGDPEFECCALRQAFKTAGQAFSVFDENTTDVLVPYGAGVQLISQMCSPRCVADPTYRKSLLDKVTCYSVSLYDYQRKKLEASGALCQICDGYALALLPEFYDDYIGLKLDGTHNSFWEV